MTLHASILRAPSARLLAVAVLLGMLAIAPRASAQVVNEAVATPVNVNLAAGTYFAVVSSEDGIVEVLQSGTTGSFGYPDAADCLADRAGQDCFRSDPSGVGAGAIGFEGTAAEVTAALASLRFTLGEDKVLADAKINVSTSQNPDPSRDLFFNPDNGHYYEFVGGTSAITWPAAKTAAEGLTLNLGGQSYTGYLATITSEAESRFVSTFVDAADVWIGASDEFSVVNAATGATTFADQAASEGRWYWVTGPEAGTKFWELGTPGTPATQEKGDGGVRVEGRFEAWKSGEPNNSSTTEHFAILNYQCGGPCSPTANWNDFAGDNANVKSFLAEFGPIAEDALALLATDVEFSIPDLIARPSAPAPSLVCTPDPVAPGGLVTCEVTGGPADFEILWNAAFNGVFAGQGLVMDEDGRGTFTFIAPRTAAGQSVSVVLVDWTNPITVGVTGQALPAALPAGEGSGGLPVLPLLLAAGLLGAGAWRLRSSSVQAG
jgi:hypothetical protein